MPVFRLRPGASCLAFFVMAALLLPRAAAAQEARPYVLQGVVLDAETGEPLPGANVQLQNTVIGASTDLDGTFEIEAALTPGEKTLLFTFLGYQPLRRTVTLGAAETVTLDPVRLAPDVIGVEEIVVTGTSAATSKRQLGNAISTLDVRDLESTGATSVDQALAGKVAGALVQQNSGDPAGGISIRLRGPSTFLGSADPLYIVDGVILNNDSPELIDLGGTAQNRIVDLNPDDIERIEVVKGAAAAALYGSRANNGVIQIFTKRGRQGAPRITYTSRATVSELRRAIEVNLAQNTQGQFLDNAGEVLLDADGNPGRRYDFQDFIFRTALGTEQNLSIAGGSGGTRYFLSGAYFFNEGIVDATQFGRASVRANVDQVLSKWASVTVNANYTNSQSRDIPNGGLQSSYGALTGFIFGPNTFDPRPDPETGAFPTGTFLANPVEVIATYDADQEINRVFGSARATLTPFEGFSIDHTIGLDTYSQVSTLFIPSGTTAPGLGTGFGRRSQRAFLQLNNDLNLRYQAGIGERIASTTLVGGTLQFEEVETIGIQATQFSPFITTVPGGSNFDQPGEFRAQEVIYGVFGQQTFGLLDRFFLTAAARLDASSVFSQDDRWQFYPKVSGSYLLSEENLWRRSPLARIVPSFKLRASVGASGGLTAIDAFDRFTTFFPTSVLGQSGLLPSTQRGAEDVQPERQREIELGVDASLFDNRLAVEFTWYDQHVEDLLLFREVAPSTGFQTALGNFGELDNTGIELLLRAAPVNTRSLAWNSTFTFATYENRVRGVDTLIVPQSFSQVALIDGQPLGVFFSDAFERDEAGEIVFDENGLPVEAAGDHIIGDPNPDFTASLINEVNLGRSWTFRAQLDASVGNDVFNFTRRLGALSVFGTTKDFQRELEGELPAGYNARVFGIFENWIEDGSYVKLRELSASYTFFPERIGLQSLRVSAIGRNLFSIDDYSGYDPETNVGGQRTAVRGFDFVQVPIPRTYTFGITATF